MPDLRLIAASGTAQRRVLEDTAAKLEKEGYVLSGRQEGGDWVSLLSENMSGGLFDEKRLIIIENAALLGPMPESLAAMVVPGSSVVVLLVYDADPGKLIPAAILKKCGVIRPEAFPRWPRERQAWVSDLARKMGLQIDRAAVSLIVELLDDPEEIRSQLASLSTLRKKEPINKKDIEELCLDDGSGNLLKLLDALCGGDAATALRTFRAMSRGSGTAELFPLVTALHNRMRLALYAAGYKNDGAAFARALGARDYAWRLANGAARRYGERALLAFVVGLIKLNIEEKSGRGAGWNSLELLVLDLLSAGS